MPRNSNRPMSLAAIAAVAVLIVLPALAQAQDNYVDWAAGRQKGDPPPSGGEVVPGPPSPVLGLAFYTDQAAFEAAAPGLPVEDFEAGNVPPAGVTGCSDPYDSTTSDACWSPGDLIPGFSIGSSSGAGTVILGAGVIGNTSIVTGPDTFVDSTLVAFTDPNTFAVGMDLVLFPETLDIDIFGVGDVLLGSTTGNATQAGSFWGVIAGQQIIRIEVSSPSGGGELVDNLQFGLGAPALTLSSTSLGDQCDGDPANENGIPEPGEGLFVDAEVTAGGGDFTNVSCTLSSASPGVDVIDGSSSYPDLASGNSSIGDSPFLVLLDPATTVCFSDIVFDLFCTSAQGDFDFDFSTTVGQALMPALPVPIPDADPAGIDSELVVADDVILNDVNVRVEIAHTWVGDLTLTLSNPSRSVVLLDRPGVPASGFGCSNDNMDVTFDDGAGGDLENHCADTDPWFVGSADPAGSLADFIGDSSAGTWTLNVSDAASGDLGEITNWELITDPPVGGTCNTCGDAGPPFAGDPLFDVEIPSLNWVGMLLLFLGLTTAAVFMLRRL